MSDAVRERIVRLNPNLKPGMKLRGWHPTETEKSMTMLRDVVGKGAVIKCYGREAWDFLKGKGGYIFKLGRREYVSHHAVARWL